MTKTKEHKKPFVASGIRQQGFFMPQLFPSMNEYSRLAAQTYGRPGHRGTQANTLKAKIENTVRLHIRLNKLQPMEAVYFFLTYFEAGRNRNKDNICACAKKFLFDALQDQGILKNDGWKEIVGWTERFMTTTVTPGLHIEMYCPFQCGKEIEQQILVNHQGTFTDWNRLMIEISR